MWYLKACRSCLTTKGNLIRIGPQAKKLFCAITGLELEEDDGFPQYFCAECYVLIKKALLFRRRSRRAHFVLKEIYAVKKQVAQPDVEIVNRHKTNLISPYSFWKPENAAAFSYKTLDAEPEEITPDIEAAMQESLSTNVANAFDIDCDANAKTIKIDYHPAVSNEKHNLEPTESKIKTDEATEIEELVKEQVNTLNSSSILVDIKPANWREIEREENEKKKNERLAEIEAALQEIHGDNGQDDDMANDDNVSQDIDLDDVFKGLKEESTQESESEPEPEVIPDPEPIPRKKKYIKKKDIKSGKIAGLPEMYTYIQGIPVRPVLEYAFNNMKIRLLSIEKQREAFTAVLSAEPFSKALYKCSICVKIFQDMDALYKHVDYHNARLKYEFGCKVCADRFQTEEHLNQHCAFLHWYRYKCSRCRENHYTLDSVVQCFKSVEVPMQYSTQFKIRPLAPEAMYTTMDTWSGNAKDPYATCPDCKIYFNTEKKFQMHMKRHLTPEDEEGKYLVCDICSLKFIGSHQLAQHMYSWHLFSYTCRKCNTQCRNRKQASDHMSKGTCSLICYVCNQSFDIKWKHHSHVFTAHRTDCGVCGAIATSPIKMYIHQLRTHGYFRLNTEAELYDVRYYCKQCAVYFMNERLLYKHLCWKKHDAARDYENGCRSCMLLFESSEALEEHRQSCENTYPRQCEFCTTIVTDPEMYQEHKVIEHKHRAPVITAGDSRLCETCGKTVKHINQHVRTHLAPTEVQVDCKYCPAKSASYTQHVCHVVYNHTPKPYRCTLCQLRFLYRSSCRDHILKTHAPVLLYACEACARQFSHLDYLQDHCRKRHGVDLKKQDKSVYLSKRMFGKVYTYPHMQIDGSLIDPNILEQTPIEMCDYMDENEKRVPYTEVFFFDLNVDPCRLHQKKKNSKEQLRAKYLRKKARRALAKMAAKENKETIESSDSIKDSVTDEAVDCTYVISDALDTGEGAMQVETEDIVGQLIEKDGQYFVLANGVLYTLEDDYVEKLQEKDGLMQIITD